MGRRAAMCRACASRRCRRYLLRTLSHRYPTACTSSSVPSILGGREAVVLRRRVQPPASKGRLFLGANIRFRGAGRLMGGTQVAPYEAEHRGKGRDPCRPLTGELGDYLVPQGLDPCSQDFKPHGTGRPESWDIALPGSTPALPLGVPELLRPWGRGEQGRPPLVPCRRWPWSPWAWQ